MYWERGLAYENKGEHDRAIADFTEAIRLDPKYDIEYYGRGLAYENKGDYDKAIPDYTEAIRLDPKDARAYWGRGVAYGKKDEIDKAITDLTEAIRLDPAYAKSKLLDRDVFKKLVIGKTKVQVLDLLGKPDNTFEVAPWQYWEYKKRTKDSVTDKGDGTVQLMFEDGKIGAANFMPY